MKKFLSMVLAAALVLAMIVPAKAAVDLNTKIDESITFAEMELAEGAHRIKMNLASTGVAPADVYGVTFTIKVTDLSAGVGGAIVNNSESVGWWKDLTEWGNADAKKPVSMVATDTADVYTLTYTQATPIFADSDKDVMNLVIACYWGKDIDELKQVDVLDKDGKVIYTTAPAVVPAAPTATPDPVPSTGDSAPVVLAVLFAAVSVLVVASRKKASAK